MSSVLNPDLVGRRRAELMNARIIPLALFFSMFLTTVLIFFLHLHRFRPWVAFSSAFARALISLAHKVRSEALFGISGIFQASAKTSGMSFLVLLLIVLNLLAILSRTRHSESSCCPRRAFFASACRFLACQIMQSNLSLQPFCLLLEVPCTHFFLLVVYASVMASKHSSSLLLNLMAMSSRCMSASGSNGAEVRLSPVIEFCHPSPVVSFIHSVWSSGELSSFTRLSSCVLTSTACFSRFATSCSASDSLMHLYRSLLNSSRFLGSLMYLNLGSGLTTACLCSRMTAVRLSAAVQSISMYVGWWRELEDSLLSTPARVIAPACSRVPEAYT